MRKKSAYAWCLVAALTMAGCSSDQNEAVDVSAKTGTFEIAINFANPDGGTRAGSTTVPTTSWSNIQQIQFFLYDASGSIKWSATELPSGGTLSGTAITYTYATVPADTYTLVAVANAKSSSDAVTTYVGTAAQEWTTANVATKGVSTLSIRHKTGTWGSAITGTPAATAAVAALAPHVAPSEVFMGYASSVTVSSTAPVPVTLNLTREVSLMRVRIDQTTNAPAASNVDFTVSANAAVMLYNLPNQMGIMSSTAGGITNATTPTNALYSGGVFSTTAAGYLNDNYSSWKDVVVFPNNGGRANNANVTATATSKYFIVLCGVAKAGHTYANGATANVGDPVFWYGQINEVFTPNKIREVNLVLETGGSLVPPPVVVEYGGLDITVNTPIAWDSNIVDSTIAM